jgi:hypothetical protein
MKLEKSTVAMVARLRTRVSHRRLPPLSSLGDTGTGVSEEIRPAPSGGGLYITIINDHGHEDCSRSSCS